MMNEVDGTTPAVILGLVGDSTTGVGCPLFLAV